MLHQFLPLLAVLQISAPQVATLPVVSSYSEIPRCVVLDRYIVLDRHRGLQEEVPAATEYDSLLAEYDTAEKSWRESFKAAKGKARTALRQAHPTREFWARFEALAEGGEGRAFLWLADHARHGDFSMREQRDLQYEFYQRLFWEHPSAAYLDEASAKLVRLRKRLGEEEVVEIMLQAFERSRDKNIRALIGLRISQALLPSKNEDLVAMGQEWLRRVAEEFPQTRWGAEAVDQIFVGEHLVVGAIAPDFEGTTFDGDTFRLSDYRGKVVVLDFFGFW